MDAKRPNDPKPTGSDAPTTAVYRVGDLVVDIGRARVSRNDGDISLPKLSFDLLVALVHAAPNLLTSDEMMNRVWPGLVVSPETVTQRIKVLRDSLGDDRKAPRYIAGVRGRGYRLLADVVALVPPPPAKSRAPTVRAGAPERLLAGAVLLLTLITAGAGVWWKARQGAASVVVSRKIVEVTAPPPRSIVVLPFENLSTAANGDVIAFGMSEAVLHRLANLNQLLVIARTSSFAFKGRNEDPRETARRLNARYLLAGSVQNESGRMRVTAQLIDSATGAQVWSIRLDRPPQDLFAVQDEIAVAVAQSLELSLDAAESQKIAGRGTRSIDAWLAYQQGLALLATRRGPDVKAAAERFQQAIEIDPRFASAYASLAEARTSEGYVAHGEFWFGVPPELTPDDTQKIDALLAKALALDPNNGDAFLVRAWLHQFEDSAEADFRRGLTLRPNSATGMERFARFLYRSVDPRTRNFDPLKRAAGFALIDKARQTDPLSPSVQLTKAVMVMYGQGDWHEAIALTMQSLADDPNFYPALIRLAEFKHLGPGALADAAKYGEQALALEPHSVYTRHLLSRIYLDLEDFDAAQSVITESGRKDEMGAVLLHMYRQEWRLAGEMARRGEVGTGPDFAFASLAILRHAMSTHQFAQDLGEFKFLDDRIFSWSADGQPAMKEPFIILEIPVDLARLMIVSGDRLRGERLLRLLLEVMQHDEQAFAQDQTMISPARPLAQAVLGDHDALQSVLHWASIQFPCEWWYYLQYEPAYDSLRQDPSFRALLTTTRQRVAEQRRLLAQMRAAKLIRTRAAANPRPPKAV